MDSILMTQREIQGQTVALFVLCDGVGSMALGGEVARFMTQELGDWFFAQQSLRKLGKDLSRQIFTLNQEVLDWLAGRAGATTLSAILVTGSQCHFAHVGDSRIYQSSKNLSDPWLQRSIDHSASNGALVEFVGKHKHFTLDFWETPRKAGQFLLCSDGFYRQLDWEHSAPILGTAGRHTTERKLKELAQGVIDQGETDNCSAILVTMTG